MSKETKKVGGFELPPLLEWHTFQLTQLASTAEYFTSELKNVENEYVTKFLTELETEDYKSSKISGRIIRETKRIVEKTIGDLKEWVEQAEEEWKARFHSSTSSSTSVVASTSTLEPVGNGTVEGSELSNTSGAITRSELDDLSDISDSDGNCTTIYDSSSPDKTAREHGKEDDSEEDKSAEISDDETTSKVHDESNENQSSAVDEINETVEEEESQESTTEVTDTSVNKTDGPSSPAETVAVSPPTTRSRAARSPSPAETIVAPPPSSRSRAARSPSPAETVVASLPSSKGSRALRSPSPAETIVASTSSRGSKAARSPSPTETVFLGPPKEKPGANSSSSTPTRVPRSRIRSPSPAETVLMNKKSPAASDSEEEARRSVLAKESSSPQNMKEKKSRSSRRSPSPAETVLFGRSTNRSDSEEDDDFARRSVLSRVKEESSGSKSSVNAPFKKPKVVTGKSSDIIEQDDEVPSTSAYSSRKAAAGGDGTVRGYHRGGVTTAEGTEMQDWKLRPNSSYVLVERLPEIVLDRLKTHKVVYVTDSKVKKRRNVNDALQMAIRRLENFCPIVKKSESRNGKAKSSRSVPKRKGRKKVSSDDDEDSVTREDASTGDSTDDDEPVIKRSVKPHPPPILDSGSSAENGELSQGSEDDLMVVNNSSNSSEDDDSDAKRRVLKGSRKAAAVRSSDEDKQASDSGEDKEKKKKKSYYTPRVNVNVKDTDESDDSDDFVVTKKRRTAPPKGKLRSDSEDFSAQDRNNKSEKRYSTEELSSDSEKSDDGSRTKALKSSRRRSPSVESRDERPKKTRKKKRRRVKLLSDSDDSDCLPKKKARKKDDEVVIDSDSDVQEITEESANKGRKEIRKIISKKDLQKETRKAEEEEEKRKKRISERQAQFNGVVTLPEGERIAELILDIDPKTKEPLIKVDPRIVEKLKPHQAKGILFMWQACFESVEQFQKPDNIGSGCILAHCMGLGKTLQTVAFLHTVMTSEPIKQKIRTALVICPLNTVTNWTNEVRMWTREADQQVTVHKLYDEKNVQARVDAIKCWQRRGGVGIIHYDSFRALVEGKKIKKHLKDAIMECLADPGPDIVVCDEGHLFKNEKSKLSLAVNKIKTRRRVVLTGTPLQNNLLEYHCMMQFVKPNLLGSKKEFANRFVNPITNGQHKDSTQGDVRRMQRRAHVLHKLLDGCVQRLDYSVLVPYLPPKYEYAVFIKMTDIQNKLYLHYLNSIKQSTSIKDLVGHGQLLKHSANLAKIYCHPRALELKHLKKNKDDDESSDSAGSLKDFIDDESDPPAYESDSDIECLIDESTFPDKSSNNGVIKTEPEDPAVVPIDPANDPEALSTEIIEKGGDWWSKFFKSKSDMKYMEHSNKMIVLFEILKTCESIQDKVLVFSQYIYSLDMIEEFLEALDQEAKQNDVQTTFPPRDNPNVSRWRKNIEYFRIDGTIKAHDRQRNCDTFNKVTDTSRAKLFLISTKAGGLGINLIGANRVVIFDASWNPSQDMQSIFRVFRFGQTKPCYIYRLLAQGTIEEKIYNRQVVKLSLSCRVVDEHQIERHFTFDDIAKMFEYNPDEKSDRPTPDLPKDRLLADLLMSHKDIIDNYHEHDSLLQNQVDQGLNEDERRAAWEEYQNEKNRVVILPSANVPTPDSGVDIMQAYDKMKAKIRQMYPNVPEQVINIFIKRIQEEMLQLRVQTSKFHEMKGRMDVNTAMEYQKMLNLRKTAISNYFSLPGYLSTAMKPEVEKFMQQQRLNVSNGITVTPVQQQQQQPGPSNLSFGQLAQNHFQRLTNSISDAFRMNASVTPAVRQQEQQLRPPVPMTYPPQQMQQQQPLNGPNVVDID